MNKYFDKDVFNEIVIHGAEEPVIIAALLYCYDRGMMRVFFYFFLIFLWSSKPTQARSTRAIYDGSPLGPLPRVSGNPRAEMKLYMPPTPNFLKIQLLTPTGEKP